MENLQDHWNRAFEAPLEQLGWYESEPRPMLDLIEKYAAKADCIHLPGVGRSTLVEKLWQNKYRNLLLSDLSDKALSLLQDQYPQLPTKALVQIDLSVDWQGQWHNTFDLWADRAVLHFLLQEKDRLQYFDNLKQSLKADGRVILAQFSLQGAKKCCGLDIYPYDIERYQQYLGPEFRLMEELDYTYYNPKGDPRPYIYAVFQRS